MITIKADSKNKFILDGLGKLDRKTKQAVRKSFYHTGLDIAGREGSNNSGLIKQDMASPKSGRQYKVYKGRKSRQLKRGRIHTASRVGQAIAILTGETRDKTYFRVKGWDRLEIGTDTIQGKVWEKSRKTYIRNIAKGRKDLINNLNTEIDAIK